MVTIEQVELLESKVSRAIEYVKRLTADNERLQSASSRLVSENSMLHGKLDGYQKRISELEEILLGFKKDQERIEQGIISALDRLNLFEDAVDTMPDLDLARGAEAAAQSNAPFDSDATAHGGPVSALHAASDGRPAVDAGGTDGGNAANGFDVANGFGVVNHDSPALGQAVPAPDDDPADDITAAVYGDTAIDTAAAAEALAYGDPEDGFADTDGSALDLDTEAAAEALAYGDPADGGDAAHNAPLDFDLSALDRAAEAGEPVARPENEIPFEREADPVYGETANRSGIGAFENTMSSLDEDEFLDVLKSDRIAAPVAVAAFSEESLEKVSNGPELDIF
jgi:hypothetical protein